MNGILKSQIDYLQEFLNVLEERQTARKSSKSNQQAMYAEIPDHHKQLFRRLVSDGMNPTVEDKLLYMKDNLIKIAKHRAMKMVSLFSNFSSCIIRIIFNNKEFGEREIQKM